jgi:cytidylate kinase
MSKQAKASGRSSVGATGGAASVPGKATGLGLALTPRIVAIDGPAGSGKSTVGFAVAQSLGYLYFDTGAMYRAVTWTAIARQLDLHDETAIGRLAETMHIDILPPEDSQGNGRNSTVLVDGNEVTEEIRLSEVDQQVSLVSAYARVRDAMSRQQRRIGRHYGSGQAEMAGVVMVGRDIGTVIVPEASLKVYLDAAVDVRAQRRHRELVAGGKEIPMDQVYADLVRRDRWDSQRALSPLRVAEDAIVLDTSLMTADEVVATILKLVAQTVSSNLSACSDY